MFRLPGGQSASAARKNAVERHMRTNSLGADAVTRMGCFLSLLKHPDPLRLVIEAALQKLEIGHLARRFANIAKRIEMISF